MAILMPQTKLATDMNLHITLKPKRKLPSSLERKFWQSLLGNDFRDSLGRPEVDHFASGGPGESHIEYRVGSIEILPSDDGELIIFDREYAPSKSPEVQRVITAFLQAAKQTAHKRVDFEIDARLHLILVGYSSKRFLTENVRFSPTRRFIQAFGKHSSVRSFLLQLSENLDVAVFHPDHLDFLYHGTIATSPNGKTFVSSFMATCMNYLRIIRRHAR